MPSQPTYQTSCSDCGTEIDIDTTPLSVTAQTSPYTAQTGPAWFDAEGDLIQWECPACGYEDSYWPTFYTQEWSEYA